MNAHPPSPLHGTSAPDTFWTTTNIGETIPGLHTPLSATCWVPMSERVIRNVSRTIGAMTSKQAEVPPRPEDWIMRMFYGRAAFRADHFVGLGDRMPGTSGAAVAQGFFGVVPPGLEGKAEPQYYPLVAVKLPATWLSWPRKLRNARSETSRWAQSELATIRSSNRDEARMRFVAAVEKWEWNLYLQGVNALTMVSPVVDQLTRLCEKTGADSGITAGYGGHDETQMVLDLWACARGHLSLDAVIANHGYHGPQEGELSSRSWREDPAPLLEIVQGYKNLPDHLDPHIAEAARSAERERQERVLLEGLSASRRPAAKLLLAAAKKIIPMRGVAKAAYLQSLDVSRAAARRLGECLETEGKLHDSSDVFFLTADEIRASDWNDKRALIAARREEYESYRDLALPVTFTGPPEPIRTTEALDSVDETFLDGVAGSVGIVEGHVKVLNHPGETDVDPGDILVAGVTDPGWVSVMFLAAALVTDVGGVMSHAAVVARELGIPCVVGTKHGTRFLKTGDFCRVDGNTGRVQVLERAPIVTEPLASA